MKNRYLYFIILPFLLVSCSGSDDGSTNNNFESSNDSEEVVEEETVEEEVEEEVNDNEVIIGGETWTMLNKDVFSTTVTTEGVTLDLEQNALWYQGNQGGLLYKSFTGNFTLSAKVMVRRKSDSALAPNCDVCLGGLMARNPNNTDGENYVHLVSGNTPEEVNDGTDELGVEHKSTTNSVSPYDAIPDGLSDHELRIVRDGSEFSLYSKNIDATEWNLIITHTRADLPTTLQVGLNIYTTLGGETADLRVIYENIVLE